MPARSSRFANGMSAKPAISKRRRQCALCGGVGEIDASAWDGLYCHEITIRCPDCTAAKAGMAGLELLIRRKAPESLYDFEKVRDSLEKSCAHAQADLTRSSQLTRRPRFWSSAELKGVLGSASP